MKNILVLSVIVILVCCVSAQTNVVTISFTNQDAVNTWSNTTPGGDIVTASNITVNISENFNSYQRLVQEYFTIDNSGTNESALIGGVLVRNSRFQVRQNTVTDLTNLTGNLNSEYSELLAILLQIDAKRAEISTYLSEASAGQHQDKAHPEYMDQLRDLKVEKDRIEKEVVAIKDTLRVSTGSGLLGWFVETDGGGGDGGGGGGGN